jgi:hypothetical protein
LDGFLQKFQTANILPKAESEEFFARYAQVASVYPHDDPEMVSSHNDVFKPDNILFDGHRVWLVDWEAAFLNDRVRWASQSIGVGSCPNSGTIIGACERGKSTWRTKT